MDPDHDSLYCPLYAPPVCLTVVWRDKVEDNGNHLDRFQPILWLPMMVLAVFYAQTYSLQYFIGFN